MRKRILTLTLCVTMALTSLVGCSNNEKEPEVIDKVNVERQNVLALTAKDYLDGVEFKGLKDLSNITVDDQTIINDLNDYLKLYPAYKRAEGGVVDKTSIVNIDFEGEIDGIKFEGGSVKSFTLDVANSTLIEGIASGLVGHEPGEELDIKVTFPSNYDSNATYVDKDGKTQKLAEKDAIFHVKINFLYGEKVTNYDDLTDQVISDWLGGDITTKDELFKTQKEARLEYEIQEAELAIWDTLVEKIQIKENKKEEVQKIIDAEYEYEIAYSKKVAEYNKITYEEYITAQGFNTEEEFNTYMKASAEYVIKQNLILAYIAQENSLVLTDEEYQTEALKLAKEQGYDTVEAFEVDFDKIQINEYLHYYIVTDFILAANGLSE